jgi:hypothetical protein
MWPRKHLITPAGPKERPDREEVVSLSSCAKKQKLRECVLVYSIDEVFSPSIENLGMPRYAKALQTKQERSAA